MKPSGSILSFLNFFLLFRDGRVFYIILPIFVEFMQLLSAIQSWKSENPVFYGFSGFLQLGVVDETSDIAHVTLAVHTFSGKKEFFI